MPIIDKSVLVPFSAEAMFDLVDAVEAYPVFLPWCAGTTLIRRDDAVTAATIHINYHGIKQAFSTENHKEGKALMRITLLDGPFKNLSGCWRFTALGAQAAKVELQLEYTFSNFALEKVLGPVFEHICKTMIERFVSRAHALWGQP